MYTFSKTIAATLLAALTLTAACKKDKKPPVEPVDHYNLVSDSSQITWKGYLRNGSFNEGSMRIESSSLSMSGGQVRAGSQFSMPLSSLQNFNLPTPELKTQLIHHLQSPDFFNMPLYPVINFTINKLETYSGGIPEAVEGANYIVKGDLSMIGVSLPISFPANIAAANNTLQVAATLNVDRTAWGQTYATQDTLPDDKYILPTIDIAIKLKGTKQ